MSSKLVFFECGEEKDFEVFNEQIKKSDFSSYDKQVFKFSKK